MAQGRRTIDADAAPAALGPYSHAVLADAGSGAGAGLLFCSGQIPLDPASGELVSGDDLGGQTRRCLQNLEAVCAAAGTELRHALRLTIYTTELASFAQINEAYGSFFGEDPPARAAVGVAALPKGAKVEIDAIVAVERA